MSKRRGLVCASAWLGLAVSMVSGVSAQTPVPSDSLKGQLLGLGVRGGAATGTAGLGPQHVGQVGALAQLMSLEVSTAPVGTSTGAFAYTYNLQLGTFTRSTQSFGPTFAHRSLTGGKGKFSFGFNWLHADYGSLSGKNLTNGALRTGQNVQNFPIPFAYATLKMDLSSDTVVGFASFGVTNNFDVGIAVPWVRITLDADLRLFSASGIDLTPPEHQLFVPRKNASGVGDVAVFGKYHVWHRKEGGLAAEVQLRLPSGDTNSLRGTGVTRTLVSAIWSQGGDVSPHANVGYELWSAPVLISSSGDVVAKNQINYAFGVEFQAHPRATAIVDVIGRRQLHGGQSGYQTVALGPGSIDLLVALPEGLNVVSLAPGIKWNVGGSVLVTGNLLASLINNGLKAKLIPVVGLDWAF